MQIVYVSMGGRTVAVSQQADIHSLAESPDIAADTATVSKVPNSETETIFAKQNSNKRKRDDASRPAAIDIADSSNEEVFFPEKLFAMLEDAENAGFQAVVSWGQDGTAFRVHQKREFENSILPKYFKMTKYKSFTRQLHNYGFNWIRRGPEKGGCKKTNIVSLFPFPQKVLLTDRILLQR
jgi:hypothetical protein